VISPLLANIYLHEVLDEWFARQVEPRLRGRADLVRYADDFVMVSELEADARRVMDVLSKRFGKWPAPPSRENSIGKIQPTEPQRPARGCGRTRQFRPFGLHALLASVPAG
jgi:hypothetical protein